MAILAATDHPYRARSGSHPPGDLSAKGFFGYAPNETWKPNVNLYENDKAYLVCVDLAGVNRDEIEVTVDGQVLHIRGTRVVPAPAAEGEKQSCRVRIHLMEIDHGNFSRDVDLPQDVIQEKIGAVHRNGMLWIELPKKQ